MSYRVGTTHYNLPQTEGTDKRDWFDTNESFRNIDEDLHNAVEGVGTQGAQIEAIQVDVGNVKNDITDINAEIVTIKGKQATDEENIALNSQGLTALSNKVDSLDTDLAEMIEVTEEESATATVQHTVGSYFRYNDNLWVTTVLIRVGDEIVPNVNCETTDVMSRIYALEQGGGPGESVIDDTVTSTTKTWSSSKINTELDTKADDSKVGDLADLDTTDKSAIVAAINELYAMIGQIGGANMKCALSARVTITSATTHVNLSSLGLTSREDYMIILNGQLTQNNEFKGQLITDNESATGFDIISPSNYINGAVSYQIITFK